MNKNEFKKRLEVYNNLVKFNDDAISYLNDIDINISSSVELIKRLSSTVGAIEQMASSCVKLNNTESLDKIVKQIDVAKKRAANTLSNVRVAKDLGYDDNLEIMTKLKEGIYTHIKHLSEDFRCADNNDNFTIGNAGTLHEIVRYLHQVGVKGIYCLEYLSEVDFEISKQISLPSMADLKLIDVDNILPKGAELKYKEINHPILNEIIKLYSRSSFDKSGCEHFKGVLLKNKFITQIEMGCHYAELETTANNIENEISLTYRESSGYPNSDERTVYVRTILGILGYNYDDKKRITKSNWKGTDHDNWCKTFGETLRLLASTRDLDMKGSNINNLPNHAVNLFFGGRTGIYKILSNYDKNRFDDKEINYINNENNIQKIKGDSNE